MGCRNFIGIFAYCLLPIASCLLPLAYSLFPAPCSLLPFYIIT
ncbi:hypothetical protein [Moorena sp. SIO3H5]|nr:hypothetical protein [Moorena sp. SIO3H5]